MMTRLTFLGFICWTSIQCSHSPSSNSLSRKSAIFEIRDEKGRLIERYGNENMPDSWDNFHSFYLYNNNGQLVNERTYYDLDSTCIVKDTLGYVELFYTYDNAGNGDREIRTMPAYDTSGNVIGRDTTYIKHFKTDKVIYPE